MFPAGTRVYVCGSTIAGKKLGPKRHSLGYVSNTNMAYIIKPVKDFPIKKQTFVLFPLKVVFTRYGKEKRERCEHRDFLHIMPVFTDPPHEVNAGRIQEVMRILQGNELSKNKMWYDIACNYTNDPHNLGILIPVGGKTICRLEGNEARAWVLSIIRNDIFRHLMMKHKLLPTLQHAVGDIEIMNWVSNALKGSNPRRDLLSWASDAPENMDRLVNTIRRALIAFDTRLNKAAETLSSVSLESNSYMTWLMDKMLTDHKLSDLKFEHAKKMGLSSGLTNMTVSSKLVRDTFLNFKPKYV